MFWYLLFRDAEDVVWVASDSEGVVSAEKSRAAWTRTDASNILTQVDLAGSLRARVCRISRDELSRRAGPPYQYTLRVPRVPVSVLGQMVQGTDHAGLRVLDQEWAVQRWATGYPLTGGS